MKYKLIYILIIFCMYGMAVGYSAESSADSSQATLSNQLSEAVSQTLQLQTKLGQARAILSEIQELLKQEDKILVGIREQKGQAKKNEASFAEQNRAADVIRREIQKLRDQVKEAEKELAAQTKQEERYSRVQAEYAKAQKERLDSEARAQQTEDKLVAAQKSLAEVKNRFTETMKQVNDAKKRSRDLESAAAALKAERTRRAETLTRAEKAVAMAEQAEKERLLLAGSLAELEQNLPPQQQNLPDQADIQGEIEKEKKAIQENEEKIRKDEKAYEETQKTIAELKGRLNALQQTARSDGQNEGDTKRLQARLENLRKQRAEAEDSIKKVEGKIQENEKSIAGLTNLIAAVQKQKEGNMETAGNSAALTDELKKETALMKEVMGRLDEQNRVLETLENEKNQLDKQLLRGREQAVKEGKTVADKLNEIKLQLAGQKRLRLEAETKLQESVRKRDVLEKEKEQLKLALAVNHDQPKQNSIEQSRIESELESEKLALLETREKIEKENKTRGEIDRTIVELKKQLEARKKAARAGSQKEDNIKRLQARLEKVRGRRNEAEGRLREAEGEIKESKESAAALTNMIAAAQRQQEKDQKTAKTIAVLTDELKRETALMNEAAARVDRQNRDLKALEDEKSRLNESLILVKEKLSREEQNVSKLDEIRLQIAGQKKARADMETKLRQLTGEQDMLEKENKQLNQALIEAGNLILKNENDFRKAGRAAGELQKEKELARKSGELLREKEESVKQLVGEKVELQNKLNAAGTKASQPNERAMVESSGKDALSVEQDILNQARSGGIQSSGQDSGADQRQEKKAVKQTGSRSRQNLAAQAEEHYALGIQKWDENDMDGAAAEFKNTIRLNPDAAGAYYNISLIYIRQGRKKEACDYAYQAGECYLRTKNPAQAARMAVLLAKIDLNSPYTQKLRNKIAAAKK